MTEAELQALIKAEALATTITPDEFLRRVATQKGYKPQATHWYKALVAAEQLKHLPAPPPPVDDRVWLFRDDFDGPAGSPPDPAKWVVIPDGSKIDGACPHKVSNVFLDGNGHLVLRTRREPSGGFSGAFVGTFKYGWGWPGVGVLFSAAPPFHVEMTARMPRVNGAWCSLWAMTIDRPTSQNIYELDVCEPRMTYPLAAGVHQHTWLAGKDTKPWDGGLAVSDMAAGEYVYAANVYADRVEYLVDGLSAGTAYGVSGKFGLLLDAVVGLPGSWGSGGKQPDPADPGPWDLVVSDVSVSVLP